MKKHIRSVRNFNYINKKQTGEIMRKTSKTLAIGLAIVGLITCLTGCSGSMTDKEINDTIVDKLNSKYSEDSFRVKDIRPWNNTSGVPGTAGYTADVYSKIYDKDFRASLAVKDKSIADNYYEFYFGDKLEDIADKFEAELSEYDVESCDVVYKVVSETYTEDDFNKFLSDRKNETLGWLVSIHVNVDSESDFNEVVEHAENLVDIGDRCNVYYAITWKFGDSDKASKSMTYFSSDVTSKVQVEQQFEELKEELKEASKI